jgi:putative phosphoesterase
MRVGVLSDIHANFPALCAALRSAESKGVHQFICAGDLIGRGPHPVEVIRLMRKRSIPAVQGNMERKLLLLHGQSKRKKTDRYKAHFAWTASQLGSMEWEYLAMLPEYLMLHLQGFEILLVHGSLVSDTDSIYPSITFRGLKTKVGDYRPDILVCGHTHIPFTRRVSGMLVVNAGATGTSVDGDPRASYAVVDVKKGATPRATVVRFEYDYSSVALDSKMRKVPEPKS